jgi:hypothetical protein
MRFVLMTGAALVLVACSEQQAGPAAPAVETPASAESAGGIPGDANTLSAVEISSLLVGEFRSTQDEKVTEPPSTYAWRIFTGDQPPAGAAGAFTPASRYLELKSEEEVFYYEMGTVSEDGFDMFATGRGNMLDFARIKAPA